jgi:serine/threonine protein kinase
MFNLLNSPIKYNLPIIYQLNINILSGQPPYYGVKPLRAMFMISSKPSPTFKDESLWSENMKDFVRLCLIKDPLIRPQSKQLMVLLILIFYMLLRVQLNKRYMYIIRLNIT